MTLYKYFVISGGKTASISITSAIRNSDKREPTISAHNFNYWNETFIHSHNEKTLATIISESAIRYPRIYIVTCYREPLSRSISSFFQTFPYVNRLERSYGVKHNQMPIRTYNLSSYTMEELFTLYTKYYPRTYAWRVHHEHPFKDRQFGIDVLKHSFDTNKGYTRINNGNITYILIAFYAMPQMGNVLRHELNLPDFTIPHENVTTTKISPDIINRFIEYTKEPSRQRIVKNIYLAPELNYVHHFYGSS